MSVREDREKEKEELNELSGAFVLLCTFKCLKCVYVCVCVRKRERELRHLSSCCDGRVFLNIYVFSLSHTHVDCNGLVGCFL